LEDNPAVVSETATGAQVNDLKVSDGGGPGPKRMDDRACLSGILFVLATGIGWERLPQQLGYGSA